MVANTTDLHLHDFRLILTDLKYSASKSLDAKCLTVFFPYHHSRPDTSVYDQFPAKLIIFSLVSAVTC